MMRCAVLFAVFGLAWCAVGAPVVLIEKGDFSRAKGVTFEDSPYGKVMRIPKPGGSCAWSFKLDPKWAALRLRGEMRVTDVPVGDQSWQTGRFAMEWRDAKGKTVSPWPNNYGLTGTTDWKSVDLIQLPPTNAVSFSLSLCNLSKGGEVRFRNVSLEVVRDRATAPCNAELPEGAPVDAESLADAWKAVSPTRVRYSMNGAWRVRPSLEGEDEAFAPGEAANWGWGRIPEPWSPWRPRHAASIVLSPWFEDHPEEMTKFRPDRAWYGRKFTVPAEAAGKRAFLAFDMIASRAVAYVDGQRAGEVEFPNGEIELTKFLKPGAEQFLALDVTAYAQGETLNYNEATRANRERRKVEFKGITGDLWLDLVPTAERIVYAWAETSVEKGEITFKAELDRPAKPCRMVAEVEGCGETRRFEGDGAVGPDGVLAFTAPWPDAKLWDTHTPQNLYTCKLSVLGADGKAADTTVPFRFGFREVKIVGRDILLNGTKIHLRALWDNTASTYGAGAAKENAKALYRNNLRDGFNFVIAGNYSYAAGSVVYPQGVLDACDETGMLYSYTLPHFKDYAPLDSPAAKDRYRTVVRKILRLVRNHPGVITYALNHNAAGYLGAGNPLRIDGKYELPLGKPNPKNPWDPSYNRPQARIVRQLVRELDATRPAYHHESGNLDDFHTVNCYLNWAPIQERSEWLEHWATEGVKPAFFVEWGLPHISSWSSYRGPNFIWRTTGYMSLWSAEFAAALRNDAAYEATDEMHRGLRTEEDLWASGKAFPWVKLLGACHAATNNYWGIQARMAEDNWRSFRGWGMSAMLPWDQQGLYYRVSSRDIDRDFNPWTNLKRPGFAAKRSQMWGDAEAYAPTALGTVFRRWNASDCAWIAGDGKFTDKRHVFRPGETVRKQLLVINDRRVAQTVAWKVACGTFAQNGTVRVAAGEQVRVPIAFAAPKAGEWTIAAEFKFADDVKQTDAFAISVIEPAANPPAKLAVYDPKGLTKANLARLGFSFETIDDLSAYDLGWNSPNRGKVLVIGRQTFPAEKLPQLKTFAARGGKVLLFEQDKATLEAIGFRVQTYGMRHGFPRYRSPSLEGSQREELLRDWAGESTLVDGHTPLKAYETSAGSDTWAGWTHGRPWRNGNRGAVATVIPEKPARGDWCALVDGAFDLQYAPLLEWRIGDGRLVFCQLDVTGRTVAEPAADDLVRRLVAETKRANPPTCDAYPCGMQAYASATARGEYIIQQDLAKDRKRLYYVTDGAAELPDGFFENVKNGATALLCGLSAAEVKKWSPVPLACADVKRGYYTRIEKLPPELNGLSNGDWAWHGGIDFAAFTDKVEDGNNAIRVVRYGKGRLVFWQVPPWKIDEANRPYLRISKRRAEAMLTRLMGNLGFNRRTSPNLYADVPIATDDPYRYYHW